MGQKVHPEGFRLGVTKTWSSTWYEGKRGFAGRLKDDLKIRFLLRERLKSAAVSKVEIQRTHGVDLNKISITAAKPGVILGKSGQDVDKLKKEVKDLVGKSFEISLVELRKPELSAELAAQKVSQALEIRGKFRRIMKKAVSDIMRAGADGAKVMISGRLDGAEIARSEWHREGRVPLHTLRANIDYATSEAQTTYGKLGVKVWVFMSDSK